MNKEQEDRAIKLHKEAVLLDGLLSCHSIGDPNFFKKYAEAGVTAANVTITDPFDTPMDALRKLPPWYELFEKHSDKVLQVTSCRDIERAKKEGKLGIIIGTQNAAILESDLSLVSVYRQLGFRIMQLSYYEQNLLGEGCGERKNSGLSKFGFEVVEELNRLGLVIDVSHCGDQVRLDAIEHSKVPIIASHSNPRSMSSHRRNMTDEQIKILANKGGVIGLTAFSQFVPAKEGVRPTLEDYLSMVDYVVKLVGPDHVGLGFDLTPFLSQEDFQHWDEKYPGIGSGISMEEANLFKTPHGFDLSLIFELTRRMVARGYPDEDITKIRGGNFLRVLKQVWKD